TRVRLRDRERARDRAAERERERAAARRVPIVEVDGDDLAAAERREGEDAAKTLGTERHRNGAVRLILDALPRTRLRVRVAEHAGLRRAGLAGHREVVMREGDGRDRRAERDAIRRLERIE